MEDPQLPRPGLRRARPAAQAAALPALIAETPQEEIERLRKSVISTSIALAEAGIGRAGGRGIDQLREQRDQARAEALAGDTTASRLLEMKADLSLIKGGWTAYMTGKGRLIYADKKATPREAVEDLWVRWCAAGRPPHQPYTDEERQAMREKIETHKRWISEGEARENERQSAGCQDCGAACDYPDCWCREDERAQEDYDMSHPNPGEDCGDPSCEECSSE